MKSIRICVVAFGTIAMAAAAAAQPNGESPKAPQQQADDTRMPADPSGRLAMGGAQAPAADGLMNGHPTLQIMRASSPPLIDGRLDDEIWRGATRITEFTQTVPVEGERATEETEVYVAYDSERLYFGFYAHYSDVSLIRANRVDRDQTSGDDMIAVYFDPFLDQQRAYVFGVNGYAVQGDSLVTVDFRSGGGTATDGSIPSGDASWDTLFYSAGGLVADGWTAEIAIPFKSLRYPAKSDGEGHSWGFQVARFIRTKNETVVWTPVTRSISGFMTQMGLLQGITNLSTRRNLEIQPTFTAIQLGSLDRSSGAFKDEDPFVEGGFNVKYGITSNLTVDFTWNPDFSQIESDRPQIEVNLRFPIRFPELRPFFLEGQEIFALNQPGSVSLVHTRTIVDPRIGAKLTGKIGRAAIGVIVADDEAPGRRIDPTDPALGQTAQFVIGRVRYDMYAESYVGAIFTDREFMNGHSRVGGIDSNFRLGGANNVGVLAVRSNHRDEAGVERSGRLYFARLEHSGRNLNAYLSQKSTDPGFRTDAGFVQRVDKTQTLGRASYRWWPEQHWIVNWGPRANFRRIFDFDGNLQDAQNSGGLDFSFARNVTVGLSANRDLEQYRDVDFWKWAYLVSANVGTSRRFRVSGSFDWGDAIRYTVNPFLGRTKGATLNATLRPFSRLQSVITIDTSRLVAPVTNDEVFDVKIYRTLTTYQFTERMLFRNILQYDTFDKKTTANFLLTYRVNSGTALYVGWDDHFEPANQVDDTLLTSATRLKRTNRAFFIKLQYLFRH